MSENPSHGLTLGQQVQLVSCAKAGEKMLDRLVGQIKAENPAAFHSEESMKERRFFHQPNPDTLIPCASWVKPFKIFKRDPATVRK